MNKLEYKKYKKKWEGVKKNIFLALQDGDTNKAFEELSKVQDDPEFKVVPEVPADEFHPGSPLNELLVLLAHKKIFFTVQEKTEVQLDKIKQEYDLSKLPPEAIDFIASVEGAITAKHEEILKDNEDYSIVNGELLDDEKNRVFVNIPDAIPHFPVERDHAIPFIEKLIELGATPNAYISNKGCFYKKLITVDSEQATKYIFSKLSDKELFQLDPSGGDYLCQCLQARSSKSFDLFIQEKEDVIDFKKVYNLMSNQNLLHLAMGNYLPNETAVLMAKGTPLTQRGFQGAYPADVIPNNEIASAYEEDKNVIREDNPIMTAPEVNFLIPKDFKPHKAIIPVEKLDEYHAEISGLTKAHILKERELSAEKVKTFRTAF